MTASAPDSPKFLAADHVSWTVKDADAVAKFYCDVFDASELWRMGPLDAAELPTMEDGRDWMEAHVNVAGAKLSLIMLKLTENLNLQLAQYDAPADRTTAFPRNCDAGGHHLGLMVDDVEKAAAYLSAHGCKVMNIIEITEGPLAGHKNMYVTDPFGLPLEIVD